MKVSFFLNFLPLLLLGCTSVVTETTAFHTLPSTGAGETFALVALKAHERSMEYRSYQMAIKENLTRYGWVYTEDEYACDYAVFFDYFVGDKRVVHGSSPVFGQTGGGTSYSSGTVYGGSGASASYSGTTVAPTTFGQVGTVNYTNVSFTRALNLTILDRRSVEDVYDGKVLSVGTSGNSAVVIPILIKAMFKGFPGDSGKVAKRSFPLR